MKRPNLFIVGEPRSGTTALFEFLRQHPDIFMCNPKETGHFNSDFHKEIEDYHGKEDEFDIKDRKKYMSLFKGWKDEKYGGEATTHYLYSKTSAKEIHDFNPDAKIVMIFREPVDFLFSLHNQFFFMGIEDEGDFKKALELEPLRKEGKRIPEKIRHPSQIYYGERIKFSEEANRFIEKFGKENVKILIYDDLRADNEKLYMDVVKFLGLDESFRPEFSTINDNKTLRFKKFQALTGFLYGMKRAQWKQYVPEPIYNFVKSAFFKLLRSSSRKKINPELKKELKKKFKPEVEKLSDLTGRDLVKLWDY